MPQQFLPGDETWYATDSPASTYSAVFEDDGGTAYFYAFDRAGNGGEGAILDACHVYDVRDVVDREVESVAEIRWSADGLKAALYINGYAHAVLDFAARRGYCRSNWPRPGGAWRAPERAPWDDGLLAPFHAP